MAADAQSEPDELDNYFDAPGVMGAITPEDIHQMALKYLVPDGAVEFVVVPEASTATE